MRWFPGWQSPWEGTPETILFPENSPDAMVPRVAEPLEGTPETIIFPENNSGAMVP